MADIKKLQLLKEKPELAIFDELEKANDLLDKIGNELSTEKSSQVVEAIQTLTEELKKKETDEEIHIEIDPEEIRGEPGYTPVKGKDYFDGLPGEPGKTPSDEKLIGLIGPLIPPPVKGDKPVLGIDYTIPEPIKGDPGSPDTGEQIVEKINALPISTNDNKIHIDHVYGLDFRIPSQQSILALIRANSSNELDTTAGDLRYLKLDASNDPLTGTLSSQHIIPSTTNTYDLGSSSLYYRAAYLGGTTPINMAAGSVGIVQTAGLVNSIDFNTAATLISQVSFNASGIFGANAAVAMFMASGVCSFLFLANVNGQFTTSGTGSVNFTSSGTGGINFTGNTSADIQFTGGAGRSLNVDNVPIRVEAGSSAVRGAVGGTLSMNTTAVGNVGTGEDNLMTYSITGNTLATNNDSISFDCAGTFANNANGKTLKLKYGGTTILDSTSLAFQNSSWRFLGRIIRTGAATQKIVATFLSSDTIIATTTVYTTAAETLSGAVVLKVTGEATSNNDIVQELMMVEYNPI